MRIKLVRPLVLCAALTLPLACNDDGKAETDTSAAESGDQGCTPGELNCECNAELCLGDLQCVAGTCVSSCIPGELGCECNGGLCLGELECVGDVCTDPNCIPGELACECNGGLCLGDLECVGNVCLEGAGDGDGDPTGDGDPSGDGDGDPTGDGDGDPFCGDGNVDPGEQCDDGNTNDADSCTNDCVNTFCGDGVVQDAEECDDDNVDPLDGCSPTCTWEFRYVFVTSTFHTGNLGGLAGADAICNERAEAAGLPGTYMAWISEGAMCPATRFTKSTIPYVLPDGDLIANNWDDLIDGALAGQIILTEFGNTSAQVSYWCPHNNSYRLARTGTLHTGEVGPNRCAEFTSGSSALLGTIGAMQSYDSKWSNCADIGCDRSMPIYCFQQ